MKKFFIIVILFSFLGCGKDNSLSSSNFTSTGKGGSMARFTIIGNYMYIVDDQDLKVVDITAPENPVLTKTTNVGFGIETIYPFKNHLFIGSNQGMYIYSLNQPSSPVQVSTFEHVLSCDPVTATDSFAYVTLRNSSACRLNSGINRLDIINITDLTNPVLVVSHNVPEPWGLGIDGKTLFLCHGENGLGIYDVSDPYNLKLIRMYENINAYDVILFNKIALVIGASGFYQYDYSDLENVKLLSSMLIGQ